MRKVTQIDGDSFFPLQKARLARIKMAKATSGAAFVSRKKAAEARLHAQDENNGDSSPDEDIFELQHHHLLRCLERTTDREFVEMEIAHGFGGRPGSALSHRRSSLASIVSGGEITCCGRKCRLLARRRLQRTFYNSAPD
ncbi:unnamed protein product [Cyprideis torosa]|uniref:Uncharacterized protein n=1 Tax=Cyprideis torosa TaxID=163714 RepID=A0A7R8W2E1_9CRUS|nr:unnamed protein product [Cyprideis torosa]CAG0881760.1 unnamed protein product [Cyprideis torosa]